MEEGAVTRAAGTARQAMVAGVMRAVEGIRLVVEDMRRAAVILRGRVMKRGRRVAAGVRREMRDAKAGMRGGQETLAGIVARRGIVGTLAGTAALKAIAGTWAGIAARQAIVATSAGTVAAKETAAT